MDYSFAFDGKNPRGLYIWLNVEKNVNRHTQFFLRTTSDSLRSKLVIIIMIYGRSNCINQQINYRLAKSFFFWAYRNDKRFGVCLYYKRLGFEINDFPPKRQFEFTV